MLLAIIFLVFSCFLVIPMVTFAAECFLTILPSRKRLFATEKSAEKLETRVVVLIPAHNEEAVIEHTLQALMPSLLPKDRAVVIADNCTDRTATIAKAAGVEVIERHDLTQRGKGYALQFGLGYLHAEPPDVVVVLDADCLVEPLTVRRLAQAAVRSGRPVQGLNLTDREPAFASLQVLAILANRFTNLIRPLGLQRLRLPCRLLGTGMAIPWSIAQDMHLASGNLVEDMQLGIDLALQNHWTAFCPEARVTSALPPQNAAYITQRKRWEHGHLQTMGRQVPRLLWASLCRFDFRLFAVALDLSIPPLALMAALWTGLTGVALMLGVFGVSWMPVILMLSVGCFTGAAFLAGWAKHCRRQASFSALIAAPKYILRKSPIYVGFLWKRQESWIRTEREKHPSPEIRREPGHERKEVVGTRVR
jgi:cellulose synthase/poly-beta-1,6-N-acetylglucosamine synthase-like glycosyltransferase